MPGLKRQVWSVLAVFITLAPEPGTRPASRHFVRGTSPGSEAGADRAGDRLERSANQRESSAATTVPFFPHYA